MKLAAEIESEGVFDAWGRIITDAFAYRSAQSIDTLEAKYIVLCKPQSSALDIHILRLPIKLFLRLSGLNCILSQLSMKKI
jgi:hypothetical protein